MGAPKGGSFRHGVSLGAPGTCVWGSLGAPKGESLGVGVPGCGGPWVPLKPGCGVPLGAPGTWVWGLGGT